MKKFKIKNRQKRKYVKKHDLESSLFHAQSLTLGVVPMLITAIAFFTTFIISNPQFAKSAAENISFSAPQIPQLNLSAVSLPKLSLSQVDITFEMPAVEIPKYTFTMPEFSFPEMPTISLPEISLPKFTMPDLISPVITAFIIFSNGITGIVDAAIQGIDIMGNFILSIIQQTVSAIGFGSMAFWKMTITAVSGMLTGTVNLLINLGNGIAATFTYIAQTSLMIEKVITIWLQQVGKALLDGWNAFVWFIGTPFRYLADVTNQLIVFLTPFFTFLGQAVQNAADQLKSGGDTLIKGTNYVTSSMSAQK